VLHQHLHLVVETGSHLTKLFVFCIYSQHSHGLSRVRAFVVANCCDDHCHEDCKLNHHAKFVLDIA